MPSPTSAPLCSPLLPSSLLAYERLGLLLDCSLALRFLSSFKVYLRSKFYSSACYPSLRNFPLPRFLPMSPFCRFSLCSSCAPQSSLGSPLSALAFRAAFPQALNVLPIKAWFDFLPYLVFFEFSIFNRWSADYGLVCPSSFPWFCLIFCICPAV